MFHRSSGSDRSHFVSSTTTTPADIEDLEVLQRTPTSQKQQYQQQQHQQQQQHPHQEIGSPHSSLLGSPHRNRRPIAHSQLEDSLLFPSFLQPTQVEDPKNKQPNNGGATTIINYPNDNDNKKIRNSTMLKAICQYMSTTRLLVLVILCLQNSLFTVLRRYSQGVLQEVYSKHELLLVAEAIKMVYSAWMISKGLPEGKSLSQQLTYLIETSRKMFVLALIYGAMNILSFVSLRNISAGMFTIFAQLKIISTATFSTIILKRQYSWAKWRALTALMLGVLLFSEPIWGDPSKQTVVSKDANPVLGTAAVLIEVTLSGFASIYFEKVIKTDALQLGIWERNFQLALGSFPVYIMFIVADGGGQAGFFGGWSWMALLLSSLGAAGGLLVALSIKYGDSILKTLATTGAIVLTGLLDHLFLGGPLTPSMMIAGCQVIIAICNYSFDATPALSQSTAAISSTTAAATDDVTKDLSKPTTNEMTRPTSPRSDESATLLRRSSCDTEAPQTIPNRNSTEQNGSPSKQSRSVLVQ